MGVRCCRAALKQQMRAANGAVERETRTRDDSLLPIWGDKCPGNLSRIAENKLPLKFHKLLVGEFSLAGTQPRGNRQAQPRRAAHSLSVESMILCVLTVSLVSSFKSLKVVDTLTNRSSGVGKYVKVVTRKGATSATGWLRAAVGCNIRCPMFASRS